MGFHIRIYVDVVDYCLAPSNMIESELRTLEFQVCLDDSSQEVVQWRAWSIYGHLCFDRDRIINAFRRHRLGTDLPVSRWWKARKQNISDMLARFDLVLEPPTFHCSRRMMLQGSVFPAAQYATLSPEGVIALLVGMHTYLQHPVPRAKTYCLLKSWLVRSLPAKIRQVVEELRPPAAQNAMCRQSVDGAQCPHIELTMAAFESSNSDAQESIADLCASLYCQSGACPACKVFGASLLQRLAAAMKDTWHTISKSVVLSEMLASREASRMWH